MEKLPCRQFKVDKIRGMQAVVLGVMLQGLIKLGKQIHQVRKRLYAAKTGKKKATWQDNVQNVKGQVILHGSKKRQCLLKRSFQTDDLDAFDSDCDEAPSASSVLMAKLSSYDFETLSEVPTHDNYLDNHVIDHTVQKM
ncbi:hypothetical protein Tco_0814059 [Tanacetum coccineum]